MGLLSRAKGKAFELLVARMFREGLPNCAAKRGLTQVQSGSDACADVELQWFHVECKHKKAVNVEAAWKQADSGSPPHKFPIAVTRRDRGPILVTMQIEDFLDLVREWLQLKAR